MRRIPIHAKEGTCYALVDNADFVALSQHNWWLSERGYAKTEVVVDGARQNCMMHRLVTDCPAHLDPHHLNGVRLDNRRSNLIVGTHQINMQGFRKKAPGKSSRFRGVYWDKRGQRWVAKITINDRPIRVGSFRSELAAAAAYNDKALELFGNHAGLNDLTGDTERKRVAIERYTDGSLPIPTRIPMPIIRTPTYRIGKAKADKRTASLFRGVFKQGNGWQAAIMINRQQIYLGFFDTQRDAAHAYNEAAIKHHGERALLNDLSAIAPEDDPPIRTPQHSRYKGVGWHKKQRKWNAYAFVDGTQVSIGSFGSELEAARARDAYVREHGLKLKINLP